MVVSGRSGDFYERSSPVHQFLLSHTSGHESLHKLAYVNSGIVSYPTHTVEHEGLVRLDFRTLRDQICTT